jgi:hypothetical protein
MAGWSAAHLAVGDYGRAVPRRGELTGWGELTRWGELARRDEMTRRGELPGPY